MGENTIKLRSINDLLNEHFFIPNYQRGYRWGDTEVVALLDDLWAFSITKNESEIYCLQPVVVTPHNQGVWEIIDGQQRLTTIYIILTCLSSKRKFSIEFETRIESKSFLENLGKENQINNERNIDFSYINNAYTIVNKWINDKIDIYSYADSKIKTTLLEDVKVIWYEVNEEADPRDIFTRINMGKIPLTNAELIKALFLNEKNFKGSPHEIWLKQIELAKEWDNIEYSLQNPDFWFFLTNEEPLSARIEFLLNIIKESDKSRKINKEDPFETLLYFTEQLNLLNIEDLWKDIKYKFQVFNGWFKNSEYYHLVGYLLSVSNERGLLNDLTNTFTSTNKQQFIKELRKKIKLTVPGINNINFDLECPGVEEFNYETDRKEISHILLLFNIETVLKNSNPNERFSFKHYKRNSSDKRKWSLEHIHAQQSEPLKTSDARKQQLNESLMLFDAIKDIDVERLAFDLDEGEEETLNKEKLILNIQTAVHQDELEEDDFDKVWTDISRFFGRTELHTIDNLALLGSKENSSLSNGLFPSKRKRIINMEKERKFIPVCTRNVFLKYYSDDASHLYFWGKNDRQSYLREIESKLTYYLN